MNRQSDSRTANSIRNAAFGLGGKLASILVDFLTRTIFISLLGSTYLGANALLTNVLTALSFSELGIGTAMLYAMYKPAASGDAEKLRTLMRLFRRLYLIIGLVVAVLGAALYPLLPMIEGYDQIANFGAVYVLYLMKTLVTYWFFPCYGTLFTAHQRKYVQTAVETATHILLLLTQIAVLLLTGNYLLYLGVAVLWQMVTQLVLYLRARKAYPFLSEKKSTRLQPEEKTDIRRNIFALSLYKLNATILNSTDNIIISANQGLNTTGAYDNYIMITNYVQQILKAIFFSLTASIGNLHVTETPERKHEVFYNISFVSYWLSGFCGVCLFVLLNPFMGLWQKDPIYQLARPVVALIVTNFMIEGFYTTLVVFKDACGLYWKGKFRPVATAALNLVLSLILVEPMGVAGVVLGTILARLLTIWWFDAYLLYKYVFFRSAAPYFLRYGGYMLTVVATALVTEAVCGLIDGTTLLGFAGMCGVCLVLPNAVFLLLFHRKKEFQYMGGIVRQYAGRLLRRKSR